MRIIQGFLLLAFLGAVGVFALQNTQIVEVRFAAVSLRASVALLIVGVYLIGMLSGWTVVAFFARSFRRVTARRDK
jgi:uncharacterized integral membrane protein